MLPWKTALHWELLYVGPVTSPRSSHIHARQLWITQNSSWAASDPENYPAGRLQAHVPIGSYSTRPMENHRIASQPCLLGNFWSKINHKTAATSWSHQVILRQKSVHSEHGVPTCCLVQAGTKNALLAGGIRSLYVILKHKTKTLLCRNTKTESKDSINGFTIRLFQMRKPDKPRCVWSWGHTKQE